MKVMDFISTVLENIPLGVLKNLRGEKLCCLVYILAYIHRYIYVYMYVNFLIRRKLKQYRLENIMDFYTQQKIDKGIVLKFHIVVYYYFF